MYNKSKKNYIKTDKPYSENITEFVLVFDFLPFKKMKNKYLIRDKNPAVILSGKGNYFSVETLIL